MRIFLFISLFLLIPCLIFSQQWQSIGLSDSSLLSYSAISYPSMEVNQSGTPYVSFCGNPSGLGVRKFNIDKWENLGNSISDNGNAISRSKIKIDNFNNAYIILGGINLVLRKQNGNDWINVGAPVHTGFTQYFDLDFNSTTPYVVYKDPTNTNKCSVKKFDGGNWVYVGNAGFSSSAIEHVDIAINSAGVPFVAYRDMVTNFYIVKKFNGTDWVNVGNITAYSTYQYYNLALTIDGSQNPALVYTDGANGSKASAIKFNGTNWAHIGVQGFSLTGASFFDFKFYNNKFYTAYISNGIPYVQEFNGSSWITIGDNSEISNYKLHPTISIHNGMIYLCYLDEFMEKVVVKRFGGLYWSVLGNKGISIKEASQVKLTTNSVGNPYVLYSDLEWDGKAVVKYSNGTSWYKLGSPDFLSNDRIELPNIKVYNNNTAYVAYKDIGLSGKAVVKKYNSGSWQDIGTTLSPTEVYNLSLTLDKTGVPFVAYSGVSTSGKCVVKKLNGTNWESLDTSLSSGYVRDVKLIMDSANTPYVSFNENNTMKVMKFNGVGWDSVGSLHGIMDYANLVDLFLDKNNNPYIVYTQEVNYERLINVIKYNGNDWIQIGSPIITSTNMQLRNITIAVDNNDNPYLSFTNIWTYGRYGSGYIKKFDGTNWIDAGTNAFAGSLNNLSVHYDKTGTGKLLMAFNNQVLFAKQLALNNVFPLTMTSFSCFKKEKSIIIKWETLNEKNVSHFIIQRSSNGYEFSDIGRVYSKNRETNTYEFTDKSISLQPKTYFYRLKSVDNDLSFSYSKIVRVENKDISDFLISPNPANNHFNIEGIHEEIKEIEILNSTGQSIQKNKWSSLSGNKINIANLSKGIYYIKIKLMSGLIKSSSFSVN